MYRINVARPTFISFIQVFKSAPIFAGEMKLVSDSDRLFLVGFRSRKIEIRYFSFRWNNISHFTQTETNRRRLSEPSLTSVYSRHSIDILSQKKLLTKVVKGK